jgi:hypothetical protein
MYNQTGIHLVTRKNYSSTVDVMMMHLYTSFGFVIEAVLSIVDSSSIQFVKKIVLRIPSDIEYILFEKMRTSKSLVYIPIFRLGAPLRGTT